MQWNTLRNEDKILVTKPEENDDSGCLIMIAEIILKWILKDML
jgi:hypothetical protein